ncbi:hypothetical protein CPB84DRAFT_934566 [Gymnopilus junonius]|uniref:Uncharacterized protein n=1 Tax=Gymnopilus junonius TaxID=109634 RepID=A0A9P5NZ58_GYMJU|nr:hypothetical protein CPB84DRAFT_934566 [Gymnopilus junonius]
MDRILKAFKHSNYLLADFLSQLLTLPTYKNQHIMQSTSENVQDPLNILISSQSTSSGTRKWALSYAKPSTLLR